MPRWRPKKGRSRRYVFRKRGAGRRRARMGVRRARTRRRRLPLTGFPKSKMVKLRYVESISLNPTAAVPASHYFNASSLFDPNSSGVGHQPLGYDQWAALYGKYTVVGAKIKVTYTPQAGAGAVQTPGMMGVILDDNATFSYLSGEEILESKQGRGGVVIFGGNANANKKTVSRSYSARRFHGKPPLNNDDIEALVTANPPDSVYFGVWLSAVAQTSDPPLTVLLVEIEYIAVFSELKFLAQS